MGASCGDMGNTCAACGALEVYKALERLSVGESLTVISDYPPARQTIPPIAQQFQCTCDIRETSSGQFLILIAHNPVAGAVSS